MDTFDATMAAAREIFAEEAAKLGLTVGHWDVALSRSSYTAIEHIASRSYGYVRLADHIALDRSLSGRYAVEVIVDSDKNMRAQIATELARFVSRCDAAVQDKADEAARLAARSARIDAIMIEKGLDHLRGEERRKARNNIKKRIK